MKKAREEWGLKNIIVMVPFCRTIEEGKKVLATMKEFGLERGKNGLQVYVMCEIPANVILAEEFCKIFDGFSIGSNDLTQLTLGVDRDSALVSHVYDENNLAVKKLIREVIQTAHRHGRKVGICGQAPSDYPAFAEFLVQEGIDSISLNPDTVIKTRVRIAAAEKKLGAGAQKFSTVAAAKALTALGVVGLGLMLTGYTCTTVNYKKETEILRGEMEVKLRDLKVQVQEEVKVLIQGQISKYHESEFVEFSLAYPARWRVDRGVDKVKFVETFTHKDTNTWMVGYENDFEKGENVVSEPSELTVFLVEKFERADAGEIEEWRSAVGNATNVVSTTWNGYEARRYSVSPGGDEPFGTEVLEVYKDDFKKSKEAVMVVGTDKNFEETLKNITDFKF